MLSQLSRAVHARFLLCCGRGVIDRSPYQGTAPVRLWVRGFSFFRRDEACLLRQKISLGITAVILGFLSGCGGSSGVQAGPISITSPGGTVVGQLTSLAVGTAANVSMTPSGGGGNAGVDWTVICNGNPLNGSLTGGACGSFAPTHTSAGAASIYTAPSTIPLGNNVVIKASATDNPSATSSVTLPIVALPISVVFTADPSTVSSGGTAVYQANVLNDTTAAGINWTVTCGFASCGSLSPTLTTPNTTTATTYTAPSVTTAETVVITATSVTDSTKSASVSVSITPNSAPPSITVSISPQNVYVTSAGSSRSVSFIATVLNDPAGKGVTWSVSCSASNCGNPPSASNSGVAATYVNTSNVPAQGTITLTACSDSQPSICSSATATVSSTAPITIKLGAVPVTLGENAAVGLSATASSGSQNIVWSASCGSPGACGNFSPAQTASGAKTTYTAPSAIPSGKVVTISAASAGTSPSNPGIADITITTPVPTIAFVQGPPSTITTLERVPVSATVTNDSSPGGVTWSVTCGSTVPGGCGYVAPYQTADGATANYIAPPVAPSGTITIVATSTADSAVSVYSTPAITITPSTNVSINFVPSAPSQLPGYAVVNLNAAVTNDTTNAGVDWQVCASGCGFFTTVAAVPAIPATPTTPFVPAVAAVTATTVQGWPSGLSIPYTAPVATSQGKTVTLTATAHAQPSATASATISISNGVTGPALNGLVQAGTQPVVGASVALYAAGTSGYGSASSLIYAPGGSAYATTDSNGNFTVAAGYSCPQTNSQVYLVATGGQVGTNGANPNLAMMTALGSCSTLSSGTVVINEVTTVASAWPLAPFAANDALTGNRSYLNLGSSSTNTAGLANAFAAVNNLVNIGTGQPQTSTPSGNAAVPYVEINTLADILNSCTVTSGGAYQDGTACGNLFSNTAPLGNGGLYNYVAPTDTLQAAFNIAQHPGGSFGYNIVVGNLAGIPSAKSPFQPILTTQPNDFSIALNFTGGGGLSASSTASFFAIDTNDNLWITDSTGNHVIEWSGLGAAISPSAGYSAGGILAPGPLAIDVSGNVWISGVNNLTELYAAGTTAEGSPFAGGASGLGMAIDGLSNIWITNSTGVMKFNSVGTELSPKDGYTNPGVTSIGPIAIDDSNNVWVGSQPSGGSFLLSELSDTVGQLVVQAQLGNGSIQSQMVADGSGNIWLAADGELCKMPAYGGLGSVLQDTCYAGGPPGGSSADLGSIYNPGGIALDGAGTLWVGNAGGSSVQPNLTEIIPSQLGNNHPYAGFDSPSLAAGTLMVAADGAGNVWVLLANNTLTEYVGIATPAVTPIAVAVKNEKLGKTP